MKMTHIMRTGLRKGFAAVLATGILLVPALLMAQTNSPQAPNLSPLNSPTGDQQGFFPSESGQTGGQGGLTFPGEGAAPSTPTQNCGGSGGTLTLCNPIKETSIAQLLTDLLNIVIRLGAIVATLMFIYAGFLYLTAQGDEGRVKDAHKIFRNTAIGTAILLGAQAIVLLLENTINNVTSNKLF